MARDRRLSRRVRLLRWRRRLFLLGPPLGFVALALTLSWLKAMMVSIEATGYVPERRVWIAGALIGAVASWLALCLWWAPAARCPRCGRRMGGPWFSAENVWWVWFSRPRCTACKFDPLGDAQPPPEGT